MKNIKILFIFATILLATAGCSPKPEVKGFNEENWKEDYMGCEGLRQNEVGTLLENKEKIQGISERALVKLLGKADKTAFYKRNVRNLIYFTEPGGQCEGVEGKRGHRVIIELNALGNVTWVNEENI